MSYQRLPLAYRNAETISLAAALSSMVPEPDEILIATTEKPRTITTSTISSSIRVKPLFLKAQGKWRKAKGGSYKKLLPLAFRLSPVFIIPS